MQTKIIGFGDKFCNIFTRYGRNRNNLYRELKDKGMTYIRERRLPNNSRVILGYKDAQAKSAEYAFKVNPDLTMEQKCVNTKYMLNGMGDVVVYIDKVWADSNGEKLEQEFRTIKYRDNKVVGKTRSTLNKEYSTVRTEGEGINWLTAIPDGRVKLYKREAVGNSDKYVMTEYEDGTRTYEKRVGDTEYFFSTKA
jgi:hypothetical protein